jgi:hypothetical protein
MGGPFDFKRSCFDTVVLTFRYVDCFEFWESEFVSELVVAASSDESRW